MKSLFIVLSLVILSSCTSKTEFGDCIGLNGKKDPNLTYDYNAKNIIIGLLTMQFVIPPVIIALDELQCPMASSVLGKEHK